MRKIIDKAAQFHNLTYDEITCLIKDNSENNYLYQKADEVRKTFVGDEVHLRGLIEFSNVCSCSCLYCGLQKENSKIDRYKMSAEEIYSVAKNAVLCGYKTIVLQSGESKVYSIDELCNIIRKIKLLNVAVTLSIGEKNEAEYRALKNAGADRFLLRIETSVPSLYKKLHPDMSLSKRKSCLRFLKEIGFETGTGNLIGLPGQTDENIAEDILFFKQLNADMVGLGPFIPNPNTPLKGEIGGTFEKALKVMAIVRLLMPDINIPATTAMETLKSDGRIIALQSGANVVMPNINSYTYSSKYELYPDKPSLNQDIKQEREDLEKKLKSIGRGISASKGYRITNDRG